MKFCFILTVFLPNILTEWSHEDEYRMVIIDPSATRDYYSINTSIMARYLGCENKATSILYKKLNKDTNDYLLK